MTIKIPEFTPPTAGPIEHAQAAMNALIVEDPQIATIVEEKKDA